MDVVGNGLFGAIKADLKKLLNVGQTVTLEPKTKLWS